jgi:hypothetical protein
MAYSWLNSDGLAIKYGTTEGLATRGGEYMDVTNGYHVWEQHLKYTDFSSTNQVVGDELVIIPAGIYLEKVQIFVKTAWVGASATMDIGLRNNAALTTVDGIDDNGLVAAAAVATLSVGATLDIVKGGTAAGALLGGVSDATKKGVFTWKANTAAFSAGELLFRVYGRVINPVAG